MAAIITKNVNIDHKYNMTIKYCSPISLSDTSNLSMFIDFMDRISIDDGTHQLIFRKRNKLDEYNISSTNNDGSEDNYPNLFEDLQNAVGIEQTITEVIFWKCPRQSEVSGPYHCIHKDGLHSLPFPREYSIVIPIKNCDQVKMCWFVEKDPSKTKYDDHPVIAATDPDDFITVHEAYLTSPLIVRIDDWHNVCTESDDYAYLVSIRFESGFDVLGAFLNGSP